MKCEDDEDDEEDAGNALRAVALIALDFAPGTAALFRRRGAARGPGYTGAHCPLSTMPGRIHLENRYRRAQAFGLIRHGLRGGGCLARRAPRFAE